MEPRGLARRLARLLVAQLVEPGEPIIIGLDDTIAAVCTQLWLDRVFQRSASDREWQKILHSEPSDHAGGGLATEYHGLKVPPERIQRMVETRCFAA